MPYEDEAILMLAKLRQAELRAEVDHDRSGLQEATLHRQSAGRHSFSGLVQLSPIRRESLDGGQNPGDDICFQRGGSVPGANQGARHGALHVRQYRYRPRATDRSAGEDCQENPRDIQPIVVPHELAAVSMAHGYYNVTQQPQMVLVHTLPGHGQCARRHHQRQRHATCRSFSSPGGRRSPKGKCAAARARIFTGARSRAIKAISCASSSSGTMRCEPIKISPRSFRAPTRSP